MPARFREGLLSPTADEFRRRADEGEPVSLTCEILADSETPVSAFRKLVGGGVGYLLESIEGGEKWGRYSILGTDPGAVLRCANGHMTIRRGAAEEIVPAASPIDALAAFVLANRRRARVKAARFTGGAVGYLGYDVSRTLEYLPPRVEPDLALPDAAFIMADRLVIFDNLFHTLKIISHVHPDGRDGEEMYRLAAEGVHDVLARLASPTPRTTVPPERAAPEFDSTTSEREFTASVRAAQEYIRAGDIVQVVLSHRLSAPFSTDPFDIYRALRVLNPSPYMYYLQLPDMAVIGSSPEVLVRVDGRHVETRPIAGTRPRGETPTADRLMETELLESLKERAEHVMLVDLGRNDIGRVAEYGTVQVPRLLAVEHFARVMHLVSDVTGELRSDKDAIDALKACFPAGTVTGAPKIRAMEIIDELEPMRRGVYAGAVGYLDHDGNLDTCIAIRTAVVVGGRAYVSAGAGIVADSEPAAEYAETLHKAAAVVEAVKSAARGVR
jgi:anthranilate synthase component 1